MRNWLAMIHVEGLKASRSHLPLWTALAVLLLPLVDTFMMVILKDPEYARRAGLISAKAQLMAGTADWPTFLAVLAQAIAVGGFFLFSLISSWVFGREFSDGTAKDLLAVPVARGTILLAKFAVVMVWSLALAMLAVLAGLLLAALVGLPQGSAAVLAQGSATLAVTTALVVAVMTPVAFLASVGRGYLLPLGMTILFVMLANVLSVAGWGHFFPWSVPALYAGAGDGTRTVLGPISYAIVLLTGVAGIVGTILWWQFADQSR